MFKVMNEPGGTGYSWRIKEPGFEMAGKTGTAQVRAFSREEYARGLTKNEHLEWKMRDHAFFIGYAPAMIPNMPASALSSMARYRDTRMSPTPAR